MSSKLSPRTLFMQETIAKLPSSTKISKSSGGSTTSPSLKRRRTSSSSYHSSPDIRRKVLEKSMDQKLASMVKEDLTKSSTKGNGKGTDNDSGDVSIITLDDSNDGDGEESVSLEEKEPPPGGQCLVYSTAIVPKHKKKRAKSKSPKSKKSPSERIVLKKSPQKSRPEEVDKRSPENLSPSKLSMETPSPQKKLIVPLIETPKSSKQKQQKVTPSPTPRTSTSTSLTTAPFVPCEWVEVTRTRRKRRIFWIEAKGEEEEFKVIYKAEEHTKVPAAINGRKPFTIIQGLDYEIDEEVVGEDLDAKKDEEELKIIRNEQYMLDSFCCDAGYLSDEELNETPTLNKVVSKVKQQRRANNIKDKRKFEKLSDPVIIGPFFWSGKGGCKKELKKWQPLVFSETPIATGFNSKLPDDQVQQVEDLCDSEDEPIIKKPSCSSAATAVPSSSENPSKVTKVERGVNYDEKYAVKYFIKNLVSMKMMRTGQDNNNVATINPPISSSTPMIKNIANKVITQEHLKSVILKEGSDALSRNLEFVDKYVAKYYHKFK